MLHLAGALLESLVHALESDEELGQIAQEVLSGEAPQRLQDDPGRQGEEPQADARRFEERTEEHAQGVVVEHVDDAVGSVEEVERVGRRRRIEDHHVEAPGPPQLVDLLHRHVLEAPGHHRGERLVEAVLLDLPRLLGRRRLAIDQLVPGELEVEHHRVHLAVRLEPRGAEQLVTDSRLPISERGESKAVGEPPRRIDGEDQRLLALDREAERQRGRGGGLADPARSHAADHLSLREQGGDRGPRHRAASMAEAICSMARMPKVRSKT